MKLKWPIVVISALAAAAIAGAITYAYVHHSTPAATKATAIKGDPCLKTVVDKRYDCYASYLTHEVFTDGAPAALSDLTTWDSRDVYVRGQCHSLMHQIGHAAYTKYGSVSVATKYATEACWSGYFHGIMEAYMAQFDDAQLLAKMPDICQPTAKPYSFDYYNCLHGLGHGLTIRFGNDIFKALPYCDAIGKDWEERSCYSGAFMQNIVVDDINHKSVNLKPDDPVYPCDAVNNHQKESCYLMVTSYILKVENYDYAKTFAVCDNVESAFRATCYQSLGRDISGNFLLQPAQVISHCRMGQPVAEENCYVGAAKNAVYNDRNTVKATSLCDQVDSRYTKSCRDALAQAAGTI